MSGGKAPGLEKRETWGTRPITIEPFPAITLVGGSARLRGIARSGDGGLRLGGTSARTRWRGRLRPGRHTISREG